MTLDQDVMAALAAEFDLKDIKYYPATLTNDKRSGKVAPYADARTYMDRLDQVLGPDGWSTEYVLVDPEAKAVECRLTVDGVTKAGIGYPNEAKDATDAAKEPLKAAYSDAFKLACVAWGVGRFLYRMEFKKDWLPVDNRKFTEVPVLKDGRALGGGSGSAAQAPQQPRQAQRSAPRQAPAQAAPAPPVGRYGKYTSQTGRLDATKFSTALRQAGIGKADIVAITGEGSRGAWLIDEWLDAHPEKDLDDLILAASANKEAA